MSLRNVNLNLLPILRTLLETKSVSRAAAALYLSQPTVSDALARLRILLEDELLVRIGGEMKLTPRASDLIGPLDSVCSELEHFLRPVEFDPKHEVRELVIASSDICGFLVVRQIIGLLQEEAPGITLHLMEIDSHLRDKLASRNIDFALLPKFAIEDLAPAPLRFAALTRIDQVVLFSRDHPLAAKKTLRSEDLLEYSLVVFQPDAVITNRSRIEEYCGGFQFKIAARISQMLLIPHILIGSRSISFVTKSLADAMAATFPLETRAMPFNSLPGPMGLAWSPVYDDDPAHKWFREAIVARMAPLTPSSSAT